VGKTRVSSPTVLVTERGTVERMPRQKSTPTKRRSRIELPVSGKFTDGIILNRVNETVRRRACASNSFEPVCNVNLISCRLLISQGILTSFTGLQRHIDRFSMHAGLRVLPNERGNPYDDDPARNSS
jgi:hypothetical protein